MKVAYQFSKELAKRGHEVVVYTSDAKDLNTRLSTEPERILDSFKVHYMRNLLMMPVRKSKLFITPELRLKVKEEIKEFDVVHLHEYRSYQNVIVHHYAKKFGVPYVLQAHGSLSRIIEKQSLKWIYDVFLGYSILRDASKVIALNQEEAKQYVEMGVPEEKVTVIPNGIDLSEYANLPPKGSFKEKFNIPEEMKIVLYLGRVHKSKGIDFLLKSFSILVNRFKPGEIILTLVGPDDGYLDKAKSLARSLKISQSVLFTGFVSVEDKLGALVDADVFVTPSFYGFPVAFLEACAVGTPIITTTSGDTLEWINGNVGYVAAPTLFDLALATHRIISDDELREKFSRNCRDTVKSEFSLEKVVDKLTLMYREVAE